ncbi:MAG: eCIS core domain-containing protein [Ginsengibacter sp.]
MHNADIDNSHAENYQPVFIQRKLSVGAVDDPLEDEADNMADKVMRMPEQNFIQRKCAHCEEEERAQRKPLESFIQKKCTACEEEEAQRKPLASFIQKKQSSANNSVIASDNVSNQIQSTKNRGAAMHETTKSFMESRFGTDFSNVKIHTGNYALQLSKELNAQAFTVGNDIYFNEGKYQPESFAGKHLLAHELTHTIQQGASGLNNSIQSKQNFIQRKEDTKPIISESKEGTFDGKKIKVERIITPGECKITKNSSSSATGGFKNDKVFFEAKGCKNNVTGEAYGDLDFKDFVDGANNFIKAVPSLASGNVSDNFSKEIDKDFKDANLKASLRLVLRIGHVRVETKGTGSANLDKSYEAGVTGFIRYANGKFNIELGGGFDKTWSQLKDTDEATVHLYTDIGPVIIRVDAKHTNAGTTVEGKIGDADISKNHGIGVTYSDENGDKKVIFNFSFTLPERISTENAPECVFCDCEKPDIKFVCSDMTPDKPGEPPKKLERKYIPLFYNYATTDPRDDAEIPASEYDKTIRMIIQAIEDGYSIDHIEGYTSPEGPLGHRRGKFEGNEQLSANRATTAAIKIKLAIAKQLELGVYSLNISDNDKIKANLTAANNKGITVVGKNEMYGADATSTDITENKLFSHLSKELKAPAADEQDILERDRVKGQTLPEDLRGAAEKDVSSFRTGKENDKRLTQEQRLQKLYPWLRRALVIMEPPAPVIDFDVTKLPYNIIKEIIGTPVTCTDEHLKLFADTPLLPNEKLVIDNCSSKKRSK